MKAEYLNPFLKSIVMVIESTLEEAPVKEGVFLRESYPYAAENVVVILGVTGHLKGQVSLSLSVECAKKIAARMLMEESVPELDEYAQSALAELLNMIAANATMGLEEGGFTCDITPPAVVSGEHIEISCSGNVPTIVIPFTLSFGKVEANLSIVESHKSK